MATTDLHAIRISDVPATPIDAPFSLLYVRDTYPETGHPYVIGLRHVAFAADHRSGRLDGEAIESSGAPCESRGCNASLDDHKSSATLFIQVEQNHDLNAIDGLHAYLLEVKDACVALGIDGFAFPTK